MGDMSVKFTKAARPTTCNECVEPIKVGDRVLWATYAAPLISGGLRMVRVPLCEICGELYLESQDHPIERIL